MAILSLPSVTRFTDSQFDLVYNTLTHQSTLNRAAETIGFPGAVWRLEVETASFAYDSAEARAWRALLAELRGQAGRIYIGDPDYRGPYGTAKSSPGTPVVDGGSQTGRSLDIRGAAASETGWLLEADYVAFDLPSGSRSLHAIRSGTRVDTDGSGTATLQINPPLRESPADGATIILTDPTCIMRLASDDAGGWAGSKHRRASFGMTFIESYEEGA